MAPHGELQQDSRVLNTGDLKRGRFSHTATLLPDGKILVAGGLGYNVSASITSQVSLDSSELYDPSTGRWSFVSNLNTARNLHTATLLADGNALLVGGLDGFSIGGIRSAGWVTLLQFLQQ